MAYLKVGSLVVLEHATATDYMLVEGVSLPPALKRPEVEAALDAGGSPTGELYSLAPRTWPLVTDCATGAASEAAISALGRACGQGVLIEWEPYAGRGVRTTTMTRGSVEDPYDRSDPTCIPISLACICERYWRGSDTAPSSGTFHGSLDSVDVTIADYPGDVPTVPCLTLTGLVVGGTYVLGAWRNPSALTWYSDYSDTVDSDTNNGCKTEIGTFDFTMANAARIPVVHCARLKGTGSISYMGGAADIILQGPGADYGTVWLSPAVMDPCLGATDANGTISADWEAFVPIPDGGMVFTASATTATLEGAVWSGIESPSMFSPITNAEGTTRLYLAGGGTAAPGDVGVAIVYQPLYLSA